MEQQIARYSEIVRSHGAAELGLPPTTGCPCLERSGGGRQPPDELDAHLRREAEFFSRTAEMYRQYAAAKDRGEFGTSPQTQSMRVTIEAGVRLHEALSEWARWAATVPPAAPQK